METIEQPPKQRLSFSKVLPKLQLAWDSTSSGALKRCPRYYQYNILEGYVTRTENIHLRWGSEYNNALVTYHKNKAAGKDHETAMLAALRYAMEHTWDDELGRPWVSDDTSKNRETLIRSVIWYLIKFEADAVETVVLADGTAAVEMPFRINLEETCELTDEVYLFCGYLDRKVIFANRNWISDWKSSKYALDEKYFARYSPDNQVSQYSFAGSIISAEPVDGVIIDAVQLGVTFSRFQRAQIKRTPAQLAEWYNDTLYFIRLNEKYVADDYWPMNDTSCEKYGGCPYREICSTSPELRQVKLKGLFQQRIWDPLQVREI